MQPSTSGLDQKCRPNLEPRSENPTYPHSDTQLYNRNSGFRPCLRNRNEGLCADGERPDSLLRQITEHLWPWRSRGRYTEYPGIFASVAAVIQSTRKQVSSYFWLCKGKPTIPLHREQLLIDHLMAYGKRCLDLGTQLQMRHDERVRKSTTLNRGRPEGSRGPGWVQHGTGEGEAGKLEKRPGRRRRGPADPDKC